MRQGGFGQRHGSVRAAVFAISLGASSLLGAAPESFANERAADALKETERKRSVDPDAVFYGDARSWSKPAEVDRDAVFAEIDEYKQLREEKLAATDPRYGILLSKANKRFRCAVRKAAKAGEYDLVAKTGSVKGVDSVPGITAAVIGKL